MENKKLVLVIIILIIALAGFLRFYNLQEIPPGVWPDEAMNANDALATIDSGEYKLFYPDNNGREGLFMWLVAFSFQIFGTSIWSLKFFSALAGTATVLMVYLLSKEIFYREEHFGNIKASCAGLTAAFLMAVSFWHINFSRIAFRAILAPLLMTASLYFLFKGFRNKKIINFILSGSLFGLGLHTYISFRIAPLVIAIPIFFFLIDYLKTKNLKKYIFFIITFTAFAALSALPMGIYFWQNPDDFMGRTGQVSVFDAENPITELSKSTLLHLGMFNFYGDPNWRHNFSGHPMIPLPVGIFFIIGLVVFMKKLIGSLKKRDYGAVAAYSILPAWFFIMLLPGILTIEGIPHALRIISVIPPVYIFAATGACSVYTLLMPIIKNRKVFVVLSFIFILGISGYEINRYFLKWAKNPEVAKAFTAQYVEIGNYINSLPEDVSKYVIINEPGKPIHGISISAQTPMFIERTQYDKVRADYIKFEDLDHIETIFDGKVFIVPIYETAFPALQEKFPEGIARKENGVLILELDN